MWCAVGLYPWGKGALSQVSKVLGQASAHACTVHTDPDSKSPVSAHGKQNAVFAMGIEAVYSCVCTRGGGNRNIHLKEQELKLPCIYGAVFNLNKDKGLVFSESATPSWFRQPPPVIDQVLTSSDLCKVSSTI